MIFSQTFGIYENIMVDAIDYRTDPADVQDLLLSRLLEQSEIVPFYYTPLRCRYCLYDADGLEIYNSPVEVVGPALPEIPENFQYLYLKENWSPDVVATRWTLGIDEAALVPAHLRHLAVRAEIFTQPAVDCPSCPPESLLKTIELTPEPQISNDLPLCQKNRKFAPDMLSDTMKSDFLDTVAATISNNQLLEPGDPVIVALSGGADSVALLASLVMLGYDCQAAHCNFHLRGAESLRDMRHVQEICRKLRVNLMTRDFDVSARQRATGESVEMACRELRYKWFENLLIQERARAVAVGHHREDNIETILLNLCRTTGIDGLRGIRYRRDFVVRPLLDLTRPQIEAFLTKIGLDYMVDSSNSSDAHLRNRLRNHVIPELLKYFPDADRSILATASNLEAAARIYHRAIDAYRLRYLRDDGSLDLTGLISDAAGDSQLILREIFKDIGLTAAQCADIIASPLRAGLKFPTVTGATVELDRGSLSVVGATGLSRPTDPVHVDLRRDVLTPINLRISRHHISEFSPQRDPDVIYLDSTCLDPDNQWFLRRWREGDRIHPYGLNGSRLVSDIFSDAKYSAADKRNAWLLTCGDQIVWVVGLRPSALFPVTPDTREYLKIKYKYP